MWMVTLLVHAPRKYSSMPCSVSCSPLALSAVYNTSCPRIESPGRARTTPPDGGSGVVAAEATIAACECEGEEEEEAAAAAAAVTAGREPPAPACPHNSMLRDGRMIERARAATTMMRSGEGV